MGPCYTCKRTVAFGGVKDHGFRFCNSACHRQKSDIIADMAAVPADRIEAEALRVRDGLCAKCGKTGRIEFHKSVFVWSAILITRTSERTFVGCSGCARKSQAMSSAGTLLLGWWGIPFGLLLTPIALLTNAYQMVRSGPRERPSPMLLEHARERLAFAHRFGTPAAGAPARGGRIEPTF